MSRKIIQIDQEKCIGCGLCTNACQHGVIELVDGKAKVMRDDYCDGLGNCLPVCPVDAISFSDKDIKNKKEEPENLACGCPGTHSKTIQREHPTSQKAITNNTSAYIESQLNQWPVQIKLASVNAPYFENANLLIAADCTAYTYGNFHTDFMKNKVTLIGCPKLDVGDYTDKLTEIIQNNNIKSVTVIRMEVPCCGGIEHAVKNALMNSQKMIPWQIITISTDGNIIE